MALLGLVKVAKMDIPEMEGVSKKLLCKVLLGLTDYLISLRGGPVILSV